jgi:hypothetical protein
MTLQNCQEFFIYKNYLLIDDFVAPAQSTEKYAGSTTPTLRNVIHSKESSKVGITQFLWAWGHMVKPSRKKVNKLNYLHESPYKEFCITKNQYTVIFFCFPLWVGKILQLFYFTFQLLQSCQFTFQPSTFLSLVMEKYFLVTSDGKVLSSH